MSFIVNLSDIPSYMPSDVLRKCFEANVDLGYRHEFMDSLVEAQRAAYNGDSQNMEKYFQEMRTCNNRFKKAKMDVDGIEKRIRADFGNKEKLTEFEELLKSAKENVF